PVIQIIKVPSHRNTLTQSREFERIARKSFSDIVGCCLAIDRCAEGEDDLLDSRVPRPLPKTRQIKLLWPTPIECREAPTENMITSAECAAALQRPEIPDLFDDTK